MAARTGVPIAALLPDAAYYRGHGANTVNVLLVDIRAWDTLGEISVLLVAATGVASMVFRHRRFGAAPRVADAGQPDIGQFDAIATSPAAGDITWLRGSELRDPRHRSLVLEVATRMIFPLIMVLSAYFFFAGHNTPGRRLRGRADRRAGAGAALSRRAAATNSARRCRWTRARSSASAWACPRAPRWRRCCWARRCCRRRCCSSTFRCSATVKLVTALFFDLGVYLIVVGLVLDVLRSLGARVDVEMAEQRPAAVMPR